jgi:hypothetical protein
MRNSLKLVEIKLEFWTNVDISSLVLGAVTISWGGEN